MSDTQRTKDRSGADPHPKPKESRRTPTRYVDPVFELEPFPFGD